MTHDYVRHGTTTLFAALNVLDGSVIGQCMARHRHQEFIRFLNRVEAAVPAGKIIHAILDNDAAHRPPRSAPGSPVTPARPSTSRRPPAPGSTPSDLLRHADPPPPATRRLPLAGRPPAAINRYLEQHNQHPDPFIWTARTPEPRQWEGRWNRSISRRVSVRPLRCPRAAEDSSVPGPHTATASSVPTMPGRR